MDQKKQIGQGKKLLRDAQIARITYPSHPVFSLFNRSLKVRMDKTQGSLKKKDRNQLVADFHLFETKEKTGLLVIQ